MTSPFPTSFSGGVIQDPGLGGVLQGSIAGVLAQMQQQKENEFRLQQLAQQQAQQQALEAYYQGQLGIQGRQEDRLGAEAAAASRGRAQVGGAMRGALGGGGGGMPSASTTQSVFQDVLGGGARAVAPGMQAIFGGVSDENLPAAVQGVQDVQALQPKAPTPPEPATSEKEFEYYSRLAQTSPERAAMYKTLFLDPKPTTQITNVVGAGETEFSKKWAEAQAGVLAEGRKSAEGAITGFPGLNEAYGLADKALTGVGAGAQLNAARVLAALGVKAGKDATVNTQTLQKLTAEGALTYLRSRDLGSGTAVSDADREFVLRLAGGDITLDRSSIKRVLRVNVGAGIMKTEDAIRDLRDQSIAYPQNATQLNARASVLERRLAPIRKRYAEMLRDEDRDATNIQKLGDQVFGPMQVR